MLSSRRDHSYTPSLPDGTIATMAGADALDYAIAGELVFRQRNRITADL